MIQEIMAMNEELATMLGVTKIQVRQISTSTPVKVTRYIKAYGPWNDEIYLTEEQFNRAKLLGFSLREAEACNE